MDEAARDPLVANGFQIQSGAGQGRNISITGVFLTSDSLAEKNRKFDEAMTIINRQRVRQEVPLLEEQLDNQVRQLDHALNEEQRLRDVVAATKQSDAKSKRQAELNAASNAVESLKKSIKEGQERLAEMREEGGFDSGDNGT